MSSPDDQQLVDVILAEQLHYPNAETAERGAGPPQHGAAGYGR